MPLKNGMHPRNLYRNRPDFKELALNYPEFRQFAKQKLCGKIELDFKDPAAVRALTTVLLKKDFNLNVELPPDRLVPTLPLRLNYILWIEDLLALLPNKPEIVWGLDIGTGACCIYPIIGASKNKWHFTATEADDVNFDSSLKTVQSNNLTDYIELKKVNPNDMMLQQLTSEILYNFSMCNPPFFDSENPETKSRTDKRHAPRCPDKGGSGSLSEIAFKGGEIQFIKKMIDESEVLKANVQIFTTMVGHKSSIAPILKMIEEAGASTWTRTEFCQGRTMRWGIAWTYSPNIPLNRLPVTPDKQRTKPPLVYTVERDKWLNQGDYSVEVVMAKIIEHLKQLKMEVKTIEDAKNMSVLEFIALQNTWTHQRRKRRHEQITCEVKINTNEEVTETCVPESKKMKLDISVEEENHEPSDFKLKGCLRVRKSDEMLILLQLEWIEGGLGRESMNQILQYLKNCLFDK